MVPYSSICPNLFPKIKSLSVTHDLITIHFSLNILLTNLKLTMTIKIYLNQFHR